MYQTDDWILKVACLYSGNEISVNVMCFDIQKEKKMIVLKIHTATHKDSYTRDSV